LARENEPANNATSKILVIDFMLVSSSGGIAALEYR